MTLPRRIQNNRGMSIVEVLVVMVVLLIGIMSVVSMFPTGFRSLRHTESVTFADRLAQGEMEKWKNNVENLPYGVVAINVASGSTAWTVDNDLNPNPPLDDKKAYNVRRILGETTKIPVGAPALNLPGVPAISSIYTVAYAPIDYNTINDLVITGGDMQRRWLDLDRDPDQYNSLRLNQYGITYELNGTQFLVYFRNLNSGNRYRISYSYWVTYTSGGKSVTDLRSVTDQQIVYKDANSGTVDIAAMDSEVANGTVQVTQVEELSDSVAREFVPLAGSAWDPSDPYEYKLANDKLGIIAFNPYGYNTTEQTAKGIQPLEAHIDYNVRDLSIIHEDKRVPDNGRVKLALKYILKLGDTIDDAGPMNDNKYYGIFAKTSPAGQVPNPEVDMMIIDVATGQVLDISDPAKADIDYQDGSITFNNYTVDAGGQQVPIIGRNLRILYKADGDWSLQLQKAYELYTRVYSGAVNYRSYTVGGTNNHKLFFAQCDSSKTVSVDYAYVDSTGVEHKVVGESHQISDIVNSSGQCEVTLDFDNPDKFGGDSKAASNQLVRIYSVSGVSLKVRVLWREGTRWLYIDKDTTLVRKTTEV